MTDINDWIKHRRTIHAAATEGPWEEIATSESPGVTSPALTGDEAVVEDMYMMSFDRTAIVDAHNTLPTVLTMVEKVLELHQPVPEPGIGYLDDGTYGDIDPPCGTCGTYDEYATPWPCATVRAIEGAIND